MANDEKMPYLKPDQKNCYAIIARGSLAFRFGPYDSHEMGRIMEQSRKDGTLGTVSFVTDCGDVPFDYRLACDMRGYPPGAPELDDDASPRCGTRVWSVYCLKDEVLMIGPGRARVVHRGQWYACPQVVGGTGELLLDEAVGPCDTREALASNLARSGVEPSAIRTHGDDE